MVIAMIEERPDAEPDKPGVPETNEDTRTYQVVASGRIMEHAEEHLTQLTTLSSLGATLSTCFWPA